MVPRLNIMTKNNPPELLGKGYGNPDSLGEYVLNPGKSGPHHKAGGVIRMVAGQVARILFDGEHIAEVTFPMQGRPRVVDATGQVFYLSEAEDHPLSQPTVRAGRKEQNDIWIDNTRVSKWHFEITFYDVHERTPANGKSQQMSFIEIKDLHSTNGTEVILESY